MSKNNKNTSFYEDFFASSPVQPSRALKYTQTHEELAVLQNIARVWIDAVSAPLGDEKTLPRIDWPKFFTMKTQYKKMKNKKDLERFFYDRLMDAED